MNTEEIHERLQDSQEAVIRVEERVAELEKKEAASAGIKNYDGQFNEIKKLLENHAGQDKTLLLQEKIKEQVQAVTRLISFIRESAQSQEYIIRELPKSVKVNHQFEDKARGFIIGCVTLLIVTALTTGAALYLWSDNRRMQENDIKFRMIRQIDPDIAYRTDTLYHQNPEAIEAETRRLEARQLAVAQAEAALTKSKERAAEAEKRLKKLKNTKRKKAER